MIRTFIADSHKLVREGLIRLLSDTPDICVVGEAGSGRETLDKIRAMPPDVLIIDTSRHSMDAIPGMDAIATVQALKQEHPGLAILALSMYPEERYAVRLLQAGAGGYLTKACASEELITAIRLVANGGRYITHSLVEHILLGPNTPHRGVEMLSSRELQTLRLLVVGKSIKEIAAELTLNAKTISTYRARILNKLGLNSTAELVRYAVEYRLLG